MHLIGCIIRILVSCDHLVSLFSLYLIEFYIFILYTFLRGKRVKLLNQHVVCLYDLETYDQFS